MITKTSKEKEKLRVEIFYSKPVGLDLDVCGTGAIFD